MLVDYRLLPNGAVLKMCFSRTPWPQYSITYNPSHLELPKATTTQKTYAEARATFDDILNTAQE